MEALKMLTFVSCPLPGVAHLYEEQKMIFFKTILLAFHSVRDMAICTSTWKSKKCCSAF